MLYNSSDESGSESKDGKPNWWSVSSRQSAPTLRETSDNFVQIDIGLGGSKNEILLRNGSKKDREQKDKNVPSISLRSIAAILEKNGDEVF